MNAWFLRANGETAHNVPGSRHFVQGEPPSFPRREFNYRIECLEGGFARVGWPATGDLRAANWRDVAARAYGDVMPARWIRNLERFSKIRLGDIVVMPADREPYDVHLGVVTPGPQNPTASAGSAPYHYHYDIAAGDWFENAHRVPVRWHRSVAGGWAVEHVRSLGGLWLSGFGGISTARDELIRLATKAGLEIAIERSDVRRAR